MKHRTCAHVRMFAATSTGDYAVFATRVGSYGEHSHRMVGQPYADPEKCALMAAKRHQRGELNVELVNLRTGVRVTVKDVAV